MKLYAIIFCTVCISIGGSLKAQSAYRLACQPDLEKLDSLLKITNIDALNGTGSTLLHIAAFCQQEGVLDYLIEKGAAIDIVNRDGDTPLLYAAQRRSTSMLKVLIEKGAEVNRINKDQNTALYYAVQANSDELFNFLIASGADINLGLSPLHRAVLNENLSFVKQLVNKETDVDVLNDRGNTPLSIALRQGASEIASFLIDNGADVDKVELFNLRGPFLGQTKPEFEAKIFAPNFISTEDFTHSPAFSPDGTEFYYTLESRKYNFGTIMTSKLVNGVWSKPIPADIDGEYREIDPFITSDGSKMLYNSNRPIEEGGATSQSTDIWMIEKESEGWGSPKHLGERVNTAYDDWHPNISDNGTLFFSSGPGRKSNIVYAELKDGVYQSAVALSDSVNSSYNDYDPLIAPDESYVIICSNRPGGFGSVDLYISFKKSDGSWTKAKNMGESVNSATIDFAPKLSPNGDYFFFNRGGDIFWINAKVIDGLR